jgi:hypothetical protein
MGCSVCEDTGLLLAEFCPLCDGFGQAGGEVWQRACTRPARAKCLLARILRTGNVRLTEAERTDVLSLTLSRRQRRLVSEQGTLLAPKATRRRPRWRGSAWRAIATPPSEQGGALEQHGPREAEPRADPP